MYIAHQYTALIQILSGDQHTNTKCWCFVHAKIPSLNKFLLFLKIWCDVAFRKIDWLIDWLVTKCDISQILFLRKWKKREEHGSSYFGWSLDKVKRLDRKESPSLECWELFMKVFYVNMYRILDWCVPCVLYVLAQKSQLVITLLKYLSVKDLVPSHGLEWCKTHANRNNFANIFGFLLIFFLGLFTFGIEKLGYIIYFHSHDHWSHASWAQPVFRWVKLSGDWRVLLQSSLGVKPTWLLREAGNSALEADPKIPLNNNKKLFLRIDFNYSKKNFKFQSLQQLEAALDEFFSKLPAMKQFRRIMTAAPDRIFHDFRSSTIDGREILCYSEITRPNNLQF